MSLLLIEVMTCVTATERSNDICVTVIDSNNDNLSLLLTEVMTYVTFTERSNEICHCY
jgi:hypothetical protein